MNPSKSNPIYSSLPIHFNSTAFQLFDLYFPLEFWNDTILFIIDRELEGKPVTNGELLKKGAINRVEENVFADHEQQEQ